MSRADAREGGYQGEPGAYSERAVRELFPELRPRPLPSFARVFEGVEVGALAVGVVPIENSYAGSINETYDLLVRHGLEIVGEHIVRISHCLLGSGDLRDVRTVYSHPQALAQTAQFIATLGARAVAVEDTAGAARMVAEEGRADAAAVASADAAELYGLRVLAKDIEDRPDNSTKFVVIARDVVAELGEPDKTSLVFETADVPGALHRCLGEFASRGINLSKLESRPSRQRAWQYHFYVDITLPRSHPDALEALTSLAAHTTFLRVLGSYPSARSATA